MNYRAETLKLFGKEGMIRAGLDPEDADVFIDGLILADLRGVSSHGITRLSTYSKRVASGVIAPKARVTALQEKDSTLLLDAGNGMGIPAAEQAMEWCIRKAAEHGCCFAAVRGGNHFGIGAHFSMMAAEKGMIGFAVSNSEAAVVPTGGSRPMLGTNPLSVAIPAGRYAPVVLDMATSVVARGKVVLAQKNGESIPEDWGVDRDGVPTTDPAKILDGGSMLPFGGPKGYAISLIIDILCSCVAGALNCRTTPHFWDDFEHPQNIGFFLGAIDIGGFLDLDTFKGRIDQMLDEFKACPTKPGVPEVLLPGEIEQRNYERRIKEGIPLTEAVVADLKRTGESFGVSFPEDAVI